MSSNVKRSKSLGNRTKTFFGLDSDYSYDEVDAWNQRRLKFCVNKFGNMNCDKLKSEAPDTSLLSESVIGNVDQMDSSLPASSWTHAAPSLNRTITSLSNRSFLIGSLVTPQTSTVVSGVHEKKKHAFRALATAVTSTISERNAAQRRIENPLQLMETIPDIGDEVDGTDYIACHKPEKPLEFAPDSMRTSKPLRWSESLVERVRSGIKRMNVQRRFSDSLMGNFICCMTPRSDETKKLVKDIDDLPQYRPYFTYWICMVQIIVFIASVSYYGFAPIRIDLVYRATGEVVTPSASIEQVCRLDYVNLFIGLRQADLIRLGARYSPCMRQDKNLHDSIIEEQKTRDRRSGCCIRNDGGGCYQTSKSLCRGTLATWVETKQGSDQRVVCGLDPEFCDNPRSLAPFQWSEDVVQWPICKSQTRVSRSNVTMTSGAHMQCEVSGRPCCIGSKAECIITTRQHCDFLRGYYHPEAALCSQVNCLNEICGMLSFINPDRPDQFYRFFTAIFLNSSVGSLVVTLVVQLSILRDLEKMAGWHRVSIIYLLSGMIGNLTSGIFLPYQVQSGASGSIFSLLSMTFTEFIQSWKLIESPCLVLAKFLALALVLFFFGFLPFFDNYAHMSGLVSGMLLSFILLPFLGQPSAQVFQDILNSSINATMAMKKFQETTKRKRLSIIVCCTLLWLVLTAVGFVFFYLWPVTHCSWCKYLNCIPLDAHFCDNMDVNITTKTTCVLKE